MRRGIRDEENRKGKGKIGQKKDFFPGKRKGKGGDTFFLSPLPFSSLILIVWRGGKEFCYVTRISRRFLFLPSPCPNPPPPPSSFVDMGRDRGGGERHKVCLPFFSRNRQEEEKKKLFLPFVFIDCSREEKGLFFLGPPSLPHSIFPRGRRRSFLPKTCSIFPEKGDLTIGSRNRE